jgi:hypothetical protein
LLGRGDADHDLKQASVPPRRLIQSQQHEAGAMRQFLLIAVVADLLAASGGTTVPEGYRATFDPKGLYEKLERQLVGGGEGG